MQKKFGKSTKKMWQKSKNALKEIEQMQKKAQKCSFLEKSKKAQNISKNAEKKAKSCTKHRSVRTLTTSSVGIKGEQHLCCRVSQTCPATTMLMGQLLENSQTHMQRRMCPVYHGDTCSGYSKCHSNVTVRHIMSKSKSKSKCKLKKTR